MKAAYKAVVIFLTLAPILAAASSAAGLDWPEWNVAFVAHRGGIVPGYPENTLAAFRQAVKHGAEVFEVDLRGTKDGEVVIMHDETLDRTTNGTGNVTDYTLAELKNWMLAAVSASPRTKRRCSSWPAPECSCYSTSRKARSSISGKWSG